MTDPGQADAARSTDTDIGKDQASQHFTVEVRHAEAVKDEPKSTASVQHDGGGLLSSSNGWKAFGGYGRPRLQSKASTAVSVTDVQLQPSPPGRPSRSRAPSAARTVSYAERLSSRRGSDSGDNGSIRSFRSFALDHADNVESLIGDLPSRARTRLGSNDTQAEYGDIFTALASEDAEFRELFLHEFDELEDIDAEGSNEESLLVRWRCKLKHFLILSSAGKPIYSRHGDDQLISNSIGVIQTIISYFLDSKDTLRCFVAGDARFSIVSKGHLHLVAISRMGEDDAQLRAQLEALYMQILSTLTLPNMERIFINRPSSDLRRPLEGTAPLLSALADDFSRGSPTTLLSALECLKLRKTQREVINQTLLKTKCANLLYGLVVAGGRLVSVVRPKKHSLHPGDLQLIFSMLFQAGGIRAGGGENWIPLCLPGFNNTGYLYMFVSFIENGHVMSKDEGRRTNSSGKHDEIAVILISTGKESFYELRQMRDDLVDQLEHNGSMAIIRSAVSSGRPKCAEIVPGAMIRHFLYKSRANVQFVMPASEPSLETPLAWRRLMSVYSSLHTAMHGKTSHLKLHYASTQSCMSLAWVTPTFELYCVATPTASRDALAQSASKLEHWARTQQERLFIIGGAVF